MEEVASRLAVLELELVAADFGAVGVVAHRDSHLFIRVVTVAGNSSAEAVLATLSLVF